MHVQEEGDGRKAEEALAKSVFFRVSDRIHTSHRDHARACQEETICGQICALSLAQPRRFRPHSLCRKSGASVHLHLIRPPR